MSDQRCARRPDRFVASVGYICSGKKTDARPFAETALAWYEKQAWNSRQQAVGITNIARAHALAGHEALRLIEEGLARLQSDKFNLETGRFNAARVYVSLGRIDDAVANLREMMKEATYNTSADLVRLEAMFAPLKDDPRFEVILKSAKPL